MKLDFLSRTLWMKDKKKSMLSKLKFIGKILSNIIPGRERFFPKYLYEYELKHITITLTKDEFILPKFRKTKSRGLIFDFFFPLK